MTERPILFTGESVRAILAGRKTQTRRVMKPQPDERKVNVRNIPRGFLRCPYGLPDNGDRLWVRERWAHDDGANCDDPRCGIQGHIWYCATESPKTRDTFAGSARWRSPIHMPRWASRITLELTDVRVQRLQEISEEDAEAEGFNVAGGPWLAVAAFKRTWEAINGKRSPWERNDWVWALTFRVLR